MPGIPRNMQMNLRRLELHMDTADMTLYAIVPGLRSARWTPVTMRELIIGCAQRHQFRVELAKDLRNMQGDDYHD